MLDGGPFLEAVAGHEAWKRFFARAFRTDRLAHAYLLLGPAGIGKWTFANALAARILCSGDRPDACGACGPCKRVQAGTHPDLAVIDVVADGERGLGVEAARDAVIAAFRLRPSESTRRIVLVNDAHRIEAAAQNALLKTLEEPPAGSLLLLVAPTTHGLLDTVVSRCFQVRMKRVDEETLTRFLQVRGCTREEAQRRAAASGGAPGLAIDFQGDGGTLAELCRRLIRGEAEPREVEERIAELASEQEARSAFERRRRGALLFLGALAAELRDLQLAGGDDRKPQDLLERAAMAAGAIQSSATPELAIDAFLADVRQGGP